MLFIQLLSFLAKITVLFQIYQQLHLLTVSMLMIFHAITFGSPHKHVWTYAAGYSDNGDYPYYNCPCAKYPGLLPPTFVQEHYYCESGNTEDAHSGTFYKYDALWDGESCSEHNSCCSQPGMPWFFCIIPKRVEGDFEVCICTDQKYVDGAVLVEAMEIYVQ